MSLESVACNRCGALLEIASGVRFVTCRSCNTALNVQRSATSTWTEPTPEERLDRIEENIDQLAVRNELDALDSRWDRQREEYMYRTRYGGRHLPTKTGSVVMGIVVALFGAFWTAVAAGMSWGMGNAFDGAGLGGGGLGSVFNCFPLFGLLFIAVGIGAAIYGYHRAGQYEAAKANYEAKRAEIERKLSR